jgi:hypothetical protein
MVPPSINQDERDMSREEDNLVPREKLMNLDFVSWDTLRDVTWFAERERDGTMSPSVRGI